MMFLDWRWDDCPSGYLGDNVCAGGAVVTKSFPEYVVMRYPEGNLKIDEVRPNFLRNNEQRLPNRTEWVVFRQDGCRRRDCWE